MTANIQRSTRNWSLLDDTIKDRMKKNSAWNMLYFILTFPLMFVITPLILKNVGDEVYGIWALTGTILVFIELFGGMQTPSALSVLVPKYDPKRNPRDINELVNTMFFFFLAAAAVLAAAYALAEPLIISAFFKVSPENAATVKFVLGFSVYAFLVNFVMMGFGYLMGGLNIFYVMSILHIIFAYIRFALMAAALAKGYGINGIVVAQMGTLLAESALTLYWTKKAFPPLAFGFGYFKPEKLKKLVTLSVKLFFARAASLINTNIDKLVLGFFLNPAAAAFYHLGAGVSKYILQVPEMLGLYSMLPAASELNARGMQEKLKVMFDRVNKYVFFAALFMAAGIFVFGREFTGLWLGSEYGDAFLVMWVLSLGYMASLAGFVPMQILNGLEKTRLTVTASAVSGGLNLILSAALTWKYGLKGALLGTVISVSVGAVMLQLFYRMEFRYSLDAAGAMLKPVIALAFCWGLDTAAVKLLHAGPSWPAFALRVALFTAAYGALTILAFRHFDDYDKNLLRSAFSRKK